MIRLLRMLLLRPSQGSAPRWQAWGVHCSSGLEVYGGGVPLWPARARMRQLQQARARAEAVRLRRSWLFLGPAQRRRGQGKAVRRV